MPSVTRVLSPTQFDRTSTLSKSQTLSAPPTKEQTLSTIKTLETGIQDTLSLGQTIPDSANQSVGQLNEALQNLKTLTNSGPNASLQSVLQRFQSETLPQNLERLSSSQSALQAQLAQLPPDSNERSNLELQLQAVSQTLALYQQTESLLLSSTILNPELANTPVAAESTTVPTNPDTEINTDTLEATRSPTDSGMNPENAFSLPVLLGNGVIPPKTDGNFRAYDAFYTNQNAPNTIFNQRKDALLADIQSLDAQIETLRQQGGSPEDIARLERSKPLLQNLADLYGSIGTLDGTRSRDIEADAQLLTDKIQAATQALAAVATDIDTASFESIQGQLSDLSAITSAYVQLKDLPAAERNEHNLGRFINTTYKRLGQIQIGERVRSSEPKTITGALQTYANDKSDMVTFIQRFGDLREQIRSGRLTPEQARAQALQSIPGTSNAFQESYLKLIDAEIALEQARQANLAAQAQLASAQQNTAAAQGQIAEANAATAAGVQADRQAQAAIGRRDIPGALASSRDAQSAQAAGQTSISAAQGSLGRARADRDAAAGNLQNAQALEARARNNADQVAAGAFGRPLSEPIQGVRGRADQVRSETQSTQATLTQVDAEIATTSSELSAAEQANQALASTNTQTTQDLQAAQELLQRQESQNRSELDRLNDLLGSGAGKFSIRVSAGVAVGAGPAELSAAITAGVYGSKELDGSYRLGVTFGGEASAKFKAWLFDAEAKYSFEASRGIRLKSPAQVQEFTRLLNQAITSSTGEGFNSAAAASARAELLNFLSITRQEGTNHTVELKATRGKGDEQSGGSGKITTENLTSYNFDDINGNGRQDQGERQIVEVTNGLSAELNFISSGRTYGVSGKLVRYDDGRLKSAQVGILIPSLNITENIINDAKPVLARSGIDPSLLDSPEVREAIGRLRATKGEFKSGTTFSFNITEKDGKTSVALAITNKNTIDLRGSVPVSAGVSATVGLSGSAEYSRVIPLSGN